MSGKLAPKPDSTAALTPEEKLSRAQAALEQAEAEKAAAEKKVSAAKKALDKAQAEAKATEKK